MMKTGLFVGGAVLFCGLTHPEATAAKGRTIREPVSDREKEIAGPELRLA